MELQSEFELMFLVTRSSTLLFWFTLTGSDSWFTAKKFLKQTGRETQTLLFLFSGF